MKFTILKEVFEENLQTSSKFISSKISSVQAIRGAHLKVGKKIDIITTNLSDFFYTQIEADIKKEGNVIIDLKKVLEFLSFINPGKIDVYTKDGNLIIVQGETKGYFNIYPEGDFPELPSIKGVEYKLSEKLIQKLPLVLFSASLDEARPTLTGLYITVKNGEGSFVSTDGFRLSYLSHKLKNELPEVIIPASVVSEVVRLSKGGSEVQLTISKEEKLIKFTIGSTILYSRVIEGDFPPYEKVIPKSQTTRVVVQRQDLIRNIRLVSVFAREQSDVIIIEVNKDGMYIRPKATKDKKSQVFQQLEEKDGEDVKIAFNYKYVLDFLNNISSEQVAIELTQPTAPGVFKSDDDKNLLHIIMPLRTEETTG